MNWCVNEAHSDLEGQLSPLHCAMVAGTCNGSITPPQIVHFSRSDFWFVKVICIHLSFNFSVKDCV